MSEMFGTSVPFYKMQGCGNDFVVIDNRELGVAKAVMPQWAEKICARAFGVYADGLFFIDHAPEDSSLDYIWHFYNSDGSRAEMCGNASRCAGRLAYALDIAPAEHTFGTDAGPIKARVITEGPQRGQVKVQLTPPKGTETNIALNMDGTDMTVHFADTGVPHAVVFVDDVEKTDVQKLGAAIRYHERFAPAGTNVNFAQVKDRETMLLRTYERGVENETYACGTGAAATQLLASTLGLTDATAALTTTGGEVLTISLEGGNVFLQGAAEMTFSGELYLDALGLKLR
ncbi:diaminopimelate epimerase [Salidesulfovibrio onnuriiensis]|uniref:diaminopimelate epimerase n=1 Tax=Salidesulfovibrio onnuriiensis TaxID=2583823 RepID=UPI00164FF7BF|nr:diaminopimelate epimerase [Salidesulfovibrio onnuriiensis]